MNKTEESKRSMYMAVKQYLTDNVAVYSGTSGAVDAVSTYNALLTKLDNDLQGQVTDTTGLTTNKRNMKFSLADKIFKVSRGLTALGNKNGDPTLVGQVNFRISFLQRQKDTEIVDTATKVFELGTANAADLAQFNVSNADVDAVKTARDDYDVLQQDPKTAIAGIKASTKEVKADFVHLDAHLNGVLDAVIDTFRITNAVFVNGYFAARVIFNVGFSKLAMQITVKESVNQTPLGFVNVLVTPGNISKKTTAKGNVRIGTLNSGTYSVQFSKAGFVTQVLTVNVTAGETQVIVVSMVAG